MGVFLSIAIASLIEVPCLTLLAQNLNKEKIQDNCEQNIQKAGVSMSEAIAIDRNITIKTEMS
jgi:hypothetical protein